MNTSVPASSAKLTPIVIASLGAVWIIWGSTYLAIRYGLETLPPFFMQGCRFVVASAILALVFRSRGVAWPSRRQARNAAGIGVLLLMGGVGMVTLAEDRGVGSGLVATLIAIQPMLVSLWGGIWGEWPVRREWMGMVVGLVGVGVLMSDGELVGTWSGIGLVLIACCCWSFGSVLSRRIDMPPGPMASTFEMGAAAVVFLGASLIRQEHVEMPSLRSGLALAYLAIFGSVIAFSAFAYLIGNVRASLAMSYAYVNPLIAVILGTLLYDEVLNANLIVALPIILCGIALVTAPRRDTAAAPSSPADERSASSPVPD